VAVFRPHNQGLSKLFGSLEADIVSIIWKRQQASARDIFEELRDQGNKISYGAVKTVLDRLVAKEVLARSQQSNHYIYQASLSHEEFMRSAVREIIESLFASFGDPVYAQFLDHISKSDPQELERLMQMINDAEAERKETDS
jgi:predicted transcriptional regulator